MSDITKCPGEYRDSPDPYSVSTLCKKRDTCRRYTAPADPLWQSWMDYPVSARNGTCELYAPERIVKPLPPGVRFG